MKAKTKNLIMLGATLLFIAALVTSYYLFPTRQHLILVAGFIALGVLFAAMQPQPVA